MMLKSKVAKAIAPAHRLYREIVTLARYITAVSPLRAYGTLALVVVGTCAEGLSVALLIPLLHLMSSGPSGSVNTNPDFHFRLLGHDLTLPLTSLLLMLGSTVIAVAFLSRAKMISMSSLVIDTINKIRTDLFNSIANARWSALSRLRITDLDHLLTGDIDRVQLACAALFFVVQGTVFLLGYICLSAVISLKMTLFASLSGLVMFASFRPIRRKGAVFGDQVTSERKKQYRSIGRFLSSLKVVKSYGAETTFSTELSIILTRMRDQTMTYVSMTSAGTVAYEIVAAVIGCVFIYLSVVVIHIEVGKILILSLIFMRLAPRFKDLQDHIQTLIINMPAFATMMQTKAQCDANADLQPSSYSQGLPPLALANRMEFRDVSFHYGTHRALDSISATVMSGRINALIGASGSGKSTFADLAMGLQAPSQGHIFIDGQSLDEVTRPLWLKAVAYVPQDTFLLHGTIAENLALGSNRLTEELMWDALEKANARQVVAGLPKGLSTLVGDGGTSLSGGERQRIALARALARRPQLLILDEVTSALDEQNIERVIATLQLLRDETTILIVTHNPQVAAIADHVIRLHAGQVAY